MPILKPRLNSEDKRLGSNSMRFGASNGTSQNSTNLDPSLLFSESPEDIVNPLKPLHNSKHRWDYLKNRYPYTCVNSWILCDCSTAKFIRGIEMGFKQARLWKFVEVI